MLKNLIKQSSIYFVGLALGKVITTITFILLARQLLSEGFGTFTLFITLIQVITFFGDVGLNQWYQKQVEEHHAKDLLHKILSVRIVTLIASFIIAIILFSFSSLPSYTLALFLAALIPEAFLSVLDGYYLEQRRSIMVSLKTICKSIILLVSYVFFQKNFSLEIALYTYVVSSFITLVWFFPWSHLNDVKIISFPNIHKILHQSSSYAFLIFTSFAYSRGDSLIIGYSLGNSALGIYGAAYRYLDSLSLLPTALAHNLFPISAKKAGISFQHLMKITGVMTVAGILVGFGLYLFADLLTYELLGESYRSALPLVEIFALVVVLFFMNSALSTVVQSSSYVKKFLPFGVMNTFANIALNLIFVPIYGLQAAAWVMLLTEFTGLSINIYFVKKIYKNFQFTNETTHI